MTEPEARALRADATRNRDQLLKAASRVFVSAGTEPSMRAIAREAGVGRHEHAARHFEELVAVASRVRS